MKMILLFIVTSTVARAHARATYLLHGIPLILVICFSYLKRYLFKSINHLLFLTCFYYVLDLSHVSVIAIANKLEK